MVEVVIIGGGASGLFAGIVIKKFVADVARVTIVERLEKVGKKILATGNGRCNFSNRDTNEHKYNNPAFVKPILAQFGVDETLEYFQKIGLFIKEREEGRIYPLSEIASSVLDVLRNEAKRLGVVEKCNFDVKRVIHSETGFSIESTRALKLNADYLVFATGGRATPVLGSNGSGFKLLSKFKLKITSLSPGLSGVKVDENQVKGLTGIRVKALVKLFNRKNKELLWSEFGEVLFKEDGVSGVVIMQMQSQVARMTKDKEIASFYFSLDLIPELSHQELAARLEERLSWENDENVNLFLGIFHRLLGFQLLRRAKIDLAGYTNEITTKDVEKLALEIKDFILDYKGNYDYERAQVTIGGLDVKEVSPKTLEVKKIPNLYVCGEVLDIDGECGGFNLQWAWSSAYVVGKNIANQIFAKSFKK